MNNTAVHEAAHFIIYLLNCEEDLKLPWVMGLTIVGSKYHGQIIVKRDSFPEWVSEHLRSDLPEDNKMAEIARAKREIKSLLAGLAGEIVNMRCPNNCERVLLRVYRIEKKYNNSDLNQAIAFNVAIGGQKPEEGVLPLLTYLEEAVRDVSTYWNEITEIAELLEVHKEIVGERLEDLTDKMSDRIRTKIIASCQQ